MNAATTTGELLNCNSNQVSNAVQLASNSNTQTTPTKRVYGSGCVENSRNRFRARVRNPDKTKTELGIYDTRDEAQAILDGYFEALARNAITVTGTTLRSFERVFFEERETLEKRKDIDNEKNRWANWIMAAPFADSPMHEITSKDIRVWVKWLLRQPNKRRFLGKKKRSLLSPSTAERCLDLLRAALRKATVDELIGANPASEIEVPGVDEPDWNWLRLEDQTKWEEAKLPPFIKYATMFAYGTGQRRGDMWNLRLADLHLDGPQPYIVFKMLKRKVGKKPRWVTVPLFGAALRAIQAWLPLLKKFCPKNPLGLVWPTRKGEQRRASLKRWPILRAKVGIKRHVKWHELRHTFGSSLVSGIWGRAWRLEEVRDVMGHSSVTVTERYAHLAPAKVLEAGADTAGLRSPNLLPESASEHVAPIVPPTHCPSSISRGPSRLPERPESTCHE